MIQTQAGVLAVRATNQYRRRDIITYLGLRYYLHNSATKSDEWAKQLATQLVSNRKHQPYFNAIHFKGKNNQDKIEYRRIILPGPNEALAETALLNECSKYDIYKNPPQVFSYRLCEPKDNTGLYQYYMNGLRERHTAIAKACEIFPDGIVQYTDIKRFYPSIDNANALSVWQECANRANLPKPYRKLGEQLIDAHKVTGNADECGILTGPMFSHLLANLVLRELDTRIAASLPATYSRYVDDIVLVGSANTVRKSLTTVREYLSDRGFNLHGEDSPKNVKINTHDWLVGRHDFEEQPHAISWMTFIGDLKRFLLIRPESRDQLRDIFRSQGLRIPVRDYSAAVREASYWSRTRHWIHIRWTIRSPSSAIRELLRQALWLRNHYEAGLEQLIDTARESSGFSRKRTIPKLRYRLARMIYLSEDEELQKFWQLADSIPELCLHSAVMEAIATGRIDRVLSLGTNAAQATAQPIRASGKPVSIGLTHLSDVEKQSLAVFLLNGSKPDHSIVKKEEETELLRFSAYGSDAQLMKSSNAFIRELSCLHGISESVRHPQILETAFDIDEDQPMDIIDQLQYSWA